VILAVDAHYGDEVVVAGVRFADWPDAEPASEHVVRVAEAAPYLPGEFWRRELPGVLVLLETMEPPRVVVVDAHAWLGHGRPGLGARVFEVTGIPTIGVAKTLFRGAPAMAVLHGGSAKPLWVSAAGMEAEEAARCVGAMHGPHRVPTLLRRVDALSRGA
jgi:deoxyribonuclease V